LYDLRAERSPVLSARRSHGAALGALAMTQTQHTGHHIYHAIILEPNLKRPEPDEYGTLTLPPTKVRFGKTTLELIEWARAELVKLSDGAYCTIYRIDEVEVWKVRKEDLPDNVEADPGSDC
jgi:hypothetical protein